MSFISEYHRKYPFNIKSRCEFLCVTGPLSYNSLKRCGEPLNTLSTFRERNNGQRNFGMHLIPVLNDVVDNNMGHISVGDSIEIVEYDEGRRAEWTRLFGK